MSNPNVIAFDKASVRYKDAQGNLHVQSSNISKAAINPYFGKEIPGYELLGLQPDQVYNLFRDPNELEKGMGSFARLPILAKHVPITSASLPKELIIGSIGSEVTFDEPYLVADLCFWDASAIAAIETDKVKELSSGYRYVPVMEPGEYEGESYDGRMTQIVGNHLALVEFGRAGSDVVVADSNPFKETFAMKKTKLGIALLAALGAMSPVLAQDSAFPAMIGDATRKTFDKAAVKTKALALDSDLDPNQIDNVLDALLDVSEDPTPQRDAMSVGDEDEPVVESKADKLRKLLAGKVDDATLNDCLGVIAADEEAPEAPDMQGAMDAMRAELREADVARQEVRPVVGDVFGLDTAAAVYGFALDHMKIDHKGVTEPKALGALFRVARDARAAAETKPKLREMAQDSAKKATERFPGLKRLGAA